LQYRETIIVARTCKPATDLWRMRARLSFGNTQAGGETAQVPLHMIIRVGAARGFRKTLVAPVYESVAGRERVHISAAPECGLGGTRCQTSSLLEAIQQIEYQDPHHCIGQRRYRNVAPTPLQRLAQQTVSHSVVQRLVDDEEPIDDQESRPRVLDVDLYAQRRRHISEDGVGDAVHPDRMRRAAQHVLHE